MKERIEMRKIKRKIGALVVVGMFAVLMLAQPAAAIDYDTEGDGFVGIGGGGRIIFDDEATDEIEMMYANVGIGTSSPNGKLEVLATSTQLRLAYDTNNYAEFSVASNGVLTIQSTATGGTTEDIEIRTGGFDNAIFIDDSTSRIGIGTTTPYRKLDISDSTNPQLRLSHSDAFFTDLQTTSSGYLYINPSGGNVGIGVTSPVNTLDVEGNMTVGASYSGTNTAPSNGMIVEGNVGIGTTRPDCKLHVIGDVNINGALNVDSGVLYLDDDNNRVGINTANPQYALEVHGDVWFNCSTFETGSNKFWRKQVKHTKGSDNNYRIVFDSDNEVENAYFSISAHEPKENETADENLELVRILENGNVGIATLDPTQKLHVNGSVRIRDHIYDSNNDPGTPGQILSATADGIDWIDAPDGELQDLWETIYSNDDSTSTTANSPTDTLYLDGQGIASISITGDTVIITATEVDGSTTNEIQDLWETINSDAGSTIANSPTDILNVYGAGIASTSISGDTLTITAIEVDGSTTNEIQDLWETITSDAGSTIADIPTDTLNIYGAGIASTSISGDTLTITAIEVDGSTTNEIQDLWETITSDAGSTIADSPTDTLNIYGAGIASTSISGDTLTITAIEVDGSTTNEIQDLWETIYSNDDSTSTTADSPTDTLYFDGQGIASVTISGDTVNITATEVDGDTTNELQNLAEVYAHDGATGNAVQLTAANGDIRFYNDDATPKEMLFLDESSGRIGIGTTGPGAKLDVDLGTQVGCGGAATIGHSDNSATGDWAIATGCGTTASGVYSTAMGLDTTANGGASTAIGHNTTAIGHFSFAAGTNTTASGEDSTAIGENSQATSPVSVAIGQMVIANGMHSTAMGRAITVNGNESFGIGLSNVQYTITQDHTMAIMGGKVGIGTTSPDNLLDIEKQGTAKFNLDIFHITNGVNAADMDGTETSILFNQHYYDASAPDVADAGRITVGTETDWTSTASTQDGYMAFHTVEDGSVSEQVRITSDGKVGIGATSPTGKLDVNGNDIRIRSSQTPASASASGNQGEICWDSDYIYVCVSTNTWKRAAISSW